MQPKLPSLLWILILALGLIAFIGGIIGSFWALATIEGVASFLLLIGGWLAIRSFGSNGQRSEPIVRAIALLFFALMGMSIDQPGNFIYNKPLEWVLCGSGQEITKEVEYSNPLPGTTYITNEFQCIDQISKEKIRSISVPEIIVSRFVEYLILGYLLIYISKVYDRIKIKQTLS
jgi:hypothetical protein